MPVCCRVVYLVILATVLPMSASLMPLSAVVRFVAWLLITLDAAANWFTPAPMLPRNAAMLEIPWLIAVSAAWASAVDRRSLLAMPEGRPDDRRQADSDRRQSCWFPAPRSRLRTPKAGSSLTSSD